jgi:hypothetical protein
MAGAAQAAITDRAAIFGRRKIVFALLSPRVAGSARIFIPGLGIGRDGSHGWLPFFIIQRNPA